MKTIEELIGTFEVGQRYEVYLSPNDAWYMYFNNRVIGEVVEVREGYLMGTPYFSVGDYKCWFLPEETKVKLIDGIKNESNR